MWNIFKFFFVWFWLGLVAFIGIVLIAPKPEPRIALVHGKRVTIPEQGPAGVVGLVLGFGMCVPAYFIARPREGNSGQSHYPA